MQTKPKLPNPSRMRDGVSVVRAHASTLEAEGRRAEMVESHPGRVSDAAVGVKPPEGSTPWRSKFFVLGRHSADGVDYRRGDTVSEAEARRQGLLVEPRAERKAKRLCQRCEGRGTYARNKPKGHKPDCACRFCGPCPACGGSRYEKEEADG